MRDGGGTAAETITALFTDLVASTEPRSRVGEAQADELRREHFGFLRTAIAKHGGREVKNLGNGLMVVFGGVAAALDGAVAMQQALAARPNEAEPFPCPARLHDAGQGASSDIDHFGHQVDGASEPEDPDR